MNIQQSSVVPPTTNLSQISSTSPAVDYIPEQYRVEAVAAAYSNLNPMYSSSPVPPYGPTATAENLYMSQPIHSSGFYASPENIFHQYRLQGGYYPDYHHHHHHHPSSPYVTNGFLSYDSYGLATSVVNAKEEKWHEEKYYSSDLNHSSNSRHGFNFETQTHQHSPVRLFSFLLDRH